jgi:NTE family protein
MTQSSTTGLILTGGGARAAYQVGVVAAIDRIAREAGAPSTNPFQVIAGTSAGAIIAAGLACHADRYSEGVAKLVELWSDFSADQVYRADALGVAQSGARWLSMFTLGWAIARWRRARPRSLLDNSPLHELLHRMIDFDRLPAIMADGHLHALAVTASSYSSGDHVTFYQSASTITPWTRSHRLSVRTPITIDHLLASSAIPFAFPSVRLPLEGQQEWFGDGAMRQSAPISPAVHMGAEKVLVIGAGRMREPAERRTVSPSYPSLAQIAGHAMSSIFLDSLAVDVERLERINRTLALLDDDARLRTNLKPIEVLVISPSQRLDDLAGPHLASLPIAVRSMLRAVGVAGRGRDTRGAAFLSYLLFESGYTRELIALGQADAMARRDEVLRFFGWPQSPNPLESRPCPEQPTCARPSPTDDQLSATDPATAGVLGQSGLCPASTL